MDYVSVALVRVGSKYSTEYVEKIRNGVEKYLSVPYRIYCISDDPSPVEGVEIVPVESGLYKEGWWYKMHLFDEKMPFSDTVLYLDLDVVICGDLTPLLATSSQLHCSRDFNRKFYPGIRTINSSAMSWKKKDQTDLYNSFIIKAPVVIAAYRGDQDYIYSQRKENICYYDDNLVQSYKWEIRSREELVSRNGHYGFKTVHTSIPTTRCSVAVFHGNPNPADVRDEFVKHYWS